MNDQPAPPPSTPHQSGRAPRLGQGNPRPAWWRPLDQLIVGFLMGVLTASGLFAPYLLLVDAGRSRLVAGLVGVAVAAALLLLSRYVHQRYEARWRRRQQQG